MIFSTLAGTRLRRLSRLALTTGSLLLAACSGSGGPGAATTDSTTPDIPTPAGQTSVITPTGTTQSIRTVDQLSVLYIRPSANPASPAPLLLMLPYQEGSPSNMADLTQAARLASLYGAWVAIPSIPGGGQWHDDNPLAIGADNSDHVTYLKDVIADARSTGMIDPSKIYIAGYSNSAFMAERFVCQSGVAIAGLALIAATQRAAIEPTCAPPVPLREIGFNGTQDIYVPYNGYEGSYILPADVLYSAPDTEQQWLTREGCNSASTSTTNLPVTVSDGTTVTRSENDNCSGNARVALYTINGGGHTWPGNPYGALEAVYLGTTTQNLDATLVLWQFFTAN